MAEYWQVFAELIRTPFQEVSLIWGIVPLYFALLLSELTSTKASYSTAVQTGFSLIWAGAQWLYPFFKTGHVRPAMESGIMIPVNLFVTFTVLVLGSVALVSGLRRRYPKYCSFLGHTRFINYFMIMIYPMQAQHLNWSWDRVLVIVLFALPIWLTLHFGLMPLRR